MTVVRANQRYSQRIRDQINLDRIIANNDKLSKGVRWVFHVKDKKQVDPKILQALTDSGIGYDFKFGK